jgi:hypothetical protein
MRKMLLAAVAAAALTPGYAMAQGFSGAPPLDPGRVDGRQLIKHSNDPVVTPVSTPKERASLSNDDLQRRLDALTAQEQQIRTERQAILDEAARRAKQ